MSKKKKFPLNKKEKKLRNTIISLLFSDYVQFKKPSLKKKAGLTNDKKKKF